MNNNSKIQLRSLNGEELYPTTTMANVEGLNNELTDLEQKLTFRMNFLDDIVRKDLTREFIYISGNDNLMGGDGIWITDYTAWRNTTGTTYYTSNLETETKLTNLTIYKNLNNKLEVVPGAHGEIKDDINNNCDCDCPHTNKVLIIDGTITGTYHKPPLGDKRVISRSSMGEAVYTLAKQLTPDTGYSATYYLTKDGVLTGDKINLPLHSTLVNAETKICLTDNDPVVGFKVNDRYIDYQLQNDTGTISHIYSKIYGVGKGITLDSNNNINVNINDTTVHMNYNNTGQSGLVPSSTTEERNKNYVLSANGNWINPDTISYDIIG